MKRGELSNKPSPVVALDYRILLELRYSVAWYRSSIPQLLLESSFPDIVRRTVSVRLGARGWLSTHWEFRCVGFSLGVPFLRGVIADPLRELVAEQEHFGSASEMREWLRMSPEVLRVYVAERGLATPDGIVRFFEGWHERM